jgi:hypothetical protein
MFTPLEREGKTGDKKNKSTALMRPLLIPDSGPLFSLAAGDLLGVLLKFQTAITDVVKEETIDRGVLSGASVEAVRLHQFYIANKKAIQIYPTQVGHGIQELRQTNPITPLPTNAGELSIQSLLIELSVSKTPRPIVLFEDGWFLRNASALYGNCVLVSTQAFLVNAQSLGIIRSAEGARAAISNLRPYAYQEEKIVRKDAHR